MPKLEAYQNRCKLCKRMVRNSFTDRLEHVTRYHLDILWANMQHVPDASRSFGLYLARILKGEITK